MSHDTRQTTSSPPEGAVRVAGRTRAVSLAVVLTAELMNALDGSVVYTALPTIAADTGAAALQWIHAAYALTFALGLITGGRLGDLYGRKRIFLAGTAVFTLASLLCARWGYGRAPASCSAPVPVSDSARAGSAVPAVGS
ncbi:MFS transporter [Streptomyces sp. NPDC058646]|uniref:MFS transporter n=1 Tax=Streptomyces sp. NPDC058646 TaxID=3346574 RepID=UPI0036483FD2